MKFVRLLVGLMLGTLFFLPLPAMGQDSEGSGYYVTLVARQCDDYSDIMANRLRNDYQESLEDLGPDSVYRKGQSIDPDIEDANDPNCTPLEGWAFSFGQGAGDPAHVDNLSVVGEPVSTTPKTQTSVPRLNSQAGDTGQRIAGAVTVELTKEQYRLSQISDWRSTLWLQGGSSSDPLNKADFGDYYVFGALRCSIDNQNADNVELVNFPQGQRHAFCYFYAAAPAPGSGDIVVRKELAGGATDDWTFSYSGNVTYDPSGRFDVNVDDGVGETTFHRAADTGEAWTFTEQEAEGWVFEDLTCESDNGQSQTTVTDRTASVMLAEGDTVTCTYTNERAAEGLGVYKRTVDGTGGPFEFDLESDDGTEGIGTATTDTDLLPVQAGTVSGIGRTEPVTITETLPSTTDAGHWRHQSVECNGELVDADVDGDTVSANVPPRDGPMNCLFTNEYVPTGSVTIVKTSQGGVGNFSFVVKESQPADLSSVPRLERSLYRLYDVETSAEDDPASFTVDGVRTGEYTIVELNSELDGKDWDLVDASCDAGGDSDYSNGVTFSVTEDRPNVTCTFTDVMAANPPDAPEGPNGEGGPDDSDGASLLTKTGSNIVLVGTAIAIVAVVVGRILVVRGRFRTELARINL